MTQPDAARINRKYTAKKRSFSLRFFILKSFFISSSAQAWQKTNTRKSLPPPPIQSSEQKALIRTELYAPGHTFPQPFIAAIFVMPAKLAISKNTYPIQDMIHRVAAPGQRIIFQKFVFLRRNSRFIYSLKHFRTSLNAPSTRR